MLFVFSFRVFLEKFRNNTAALATIAVFLLISTDRVELLGHNCKYPAGRFVCGHLGFLLVTLFLIICFSPYGKVTKHTKGRQ